MFTKYSSSNWTSSTNSSVDLMNTSNYENILDEDLKWLPRITIMDVNLLCQSNPSRSLTSLQRAMLPIFPITNDSNEYYPLNANVFCM